MDSVNLPETQSTPFSCKNTASNINPVSCVCCGSKDYMQAFPQAYCFTPFYPGIPKCKHCQENFEENFKFQQPYFPSPPLFHPFIHNIAFSPNFCWVHNRGDDTASNKQQNQNNEQETTRTSANFYNSCPQDKNDCKGNETVFDEDAQKQNNHFASETPFLGHYFNMSNLIESQISSAFQRFACENPIPWTCSPFIAPIISYCLLWNSQKPNMSVSSTNYTSGRPETLNKKNSENSVNQKFSNHNHKNNDNDNDSKALLNTKDIIGNSNNDLTEKKNCSQEDGLEIDQQVETNDQNSGKSSTFLSLNSLNSFKHLEKEDRNIATDICVGEEEDTEIEGFDFEDQEESDECLKSDKKNLSNKNSNVYFLLDSIYNLKENECQSPTGSPSYTDLKVKKSSSNSEEVLSGADISAAGEKHFNSLPDSDDESVKTTSLNTVSNFKEQVPSKKFIKNFTMTDQTSNIPLKEEQISVAAAGDLGGENYASYKTDTSSFEGEEGKTPYETHAEENLESAEILLKGLRNLEVKKSDIFSEESVNENLKNGRTVKSSIAKLLKNSKSKDSKPDSVKNIKQNKESNQKDIGVIKRKHSCFPQDNKAVSISDKSTKIQKTKNCPTIQQNFSGPEKQQKEQNKIQCPKKEEKSLPAKVRPLNVIKKTAKNVCKK